MMRTNAIALAVIGGALILNLGCSPNQPAPSPTASAAATVPPTTIPTPRSTATPAVTPTPVAAPFQITVDGATVTADSLPSPQTYYAQLLAKDGRDLSTCQAAPTPQPGSCPKPASLGSTDLKQQVNIELMLDDS